MTTKDKIRILTFYLPQFHPIPENDEWWGKGFTEWTNTAKAKPLFRGHYQPQIPADLGYYDLRVPEVRDEQAALASQFGIEAFCYWHYWFGNGKRLLERPFNEVLQSGKPDFPFCICWVNESWTGVWHGLSDQVLIEQMYPGKQDYEKHFYSMLEAFCDQRYLKIDKKPVFVVYKPHFLPNTKEFSELWNGLAAKEGFDGIYFIGMNGNLDWDHNANGFDRKTYHLPGVFTLRYKKNWFERQKEKLYQRFDIKRPEIYSYKKIVKHNDFSCFRDKDIIPTVLPRWDNTPRSAYKGVVLQNSTPKLFRKHLKSAYKFVESAPVNEKFIFIKAWNEWAEGNYLEPDLRWGTKYLEVIKESLEDYYDGNGRH